MSTTAPSISTPLSDDEYDVLADVLEAHSPFDLDGLTGLLHAVVVAPSIMPPSTWIPRVLPDGLGTLEDAQSSLQLLMRLYNEVVGGLAKKMVLMPEETEVDACESFAAGFVAGAELDPEWLGDAARWTFASWAAYLAGRLDLVPPSTLAKLAGDPEESKRVIAATWKEASSRPMTASNACAATCSNIRVRRRRRGRHGSVAMTLAHAPRARSTSDAASTELAWPRTDRARGTVTEEDTRPARLSRPAHPLRRARSCRASRHSSALPIQRGQ